MRIAILAFSGAKPEPELALALRRAEMEVLHFSEKEPPEKWSTADGYILISNNDEGIETTAFATLSAEVARGKPLLGLGAGAALLVKSGLVPGLENGRAGLRLEASALETAEARIRLSPDYQYNAFTRYLTPQHILMTELRSPQGRFVIPPGLLNELRSQGLNVFCYCDAKGQMLPELSVNPTGSIDNIAAIANKAGNIMALFPHPEKTLEGDALFISMRDHIASGYVAVIAPLDYWPR